MLLLIDALTRSAEQLAQGGVENARLNAERLLAHTLGLSRAQLYVERDRTLTREQVARFEEKIARRLRQEPLQYITGEAEFMSLPFKVNPSVLIPRPETEVLVEAALDFFRRNFDPDDSVSALDLGTGSGCIAISLARYRATAHVTAVDVSEAALATARENARLNGVDDRIEFLHADLLTESARVLVAGEVHLIISNPPYVSPQDFDRLPEEIREHEPVVALRDADDGLSFFRRIADVASELLNQPGAVFVEVGMGQAQKVVEIFSLKDLGEITVLKDLTGIERVVRCER
ncbi:MAG: peptide chain release factor N(5)-glutamine methyltransferase [Calditrichaeota bacterium]|nr:MAG: peptide chain release factor N(5)-glutamine methyltransferase [Calditrichota bacterium]